MATIAPLVEERFPALRLRLIEWLKGLSALGQQAGDADSSRNAATLLGSLGEPFLFMVLGEIKTGKSRFLNALLGVPGLCAEDAQAHTAAVEKLDWGETASETLISPQLKQRTAPIELLRRLSIVDTPGTNSLVPAHKEITQKFLPRADLCIFVLFAKKPPTGTEWRLLDLVQHEWRKKVLFVLQQKDLLEDEPDDLKKVVARVRSDLAARGLADAPLFCTSAKWAERGRPDSGFPELQAYIRDTVTGSNVQRLKLQSVLRSGERELTRVQAGLEGQQALLQVDQEAVQKIQAAIARSQAHSQEELATLLSMVDEEYRRQVADLLGKFEQGMELGSLMRHAFKGGVKEWIEKLQREFQDSVQRQVAHIAALKTSAFVANIRGLLDELDQEIERLHQRPAGHGALSWDQERDQILNAVRENLAVMQKGEPFQELSSADPAGLWPMAGAGGALAVVGVVLVVATNVALLDITGGALAAGGLAVAGGYLLLKRPRILREFRASMLASQDRFHDQLQALLTTNAQHLYDKLTTGLPGFSKLLSARRAELASQQEALAALSQARLQLEAELAALAAS